MQVKLTPLKTFDLEINGICFKDMRQTDQLDGVIELKGNGHVATLVDRRNNFAKLLDQTLDGDDSHWQVVRGTTEVIIAAKLSDVKPASSPPVLKPGSNDWILNTGVVPNIGDKDIYYQLRAGSTIFIKAKNITNMKWKISDPKSAFDIVKWRFAE